MRWKKSLLAKSEEGEKRPTRVSPNVFASEELQPASYGSDERKGMTSDVRRVTNKLMVDGYAPASASRAFPVYSLPHSGMIDS